MGAAARLAELGLELPEVALPLAAYVPAVRSGAYVYTSGQLPLVAGALPATGKVGIGAGLGSTVRRVVASRILRCRATTQHARERDHETTHRRRTGIKPRASKPAPTHAASGVNSCRTRRWWWLLEQPP